MAILNDDPKSPYAGANPKAVMVRVEPRTAQGYGGQRKHDLRIGPQPKYVKADKLHENRSLLAYTPTADLKQKCVDRRRQKKRQRAMKSNASIAFIGIVGFGKEAQDFFRELPRERQDEALLAVANRCAAEMHTTLEGAEYHGDETAPHLHFVCAGYDLDGEPLTETVKRGVLARLQDISAEIMQEYDPRFERGNSRHDRLAAGADPADLVHKTVKELHNDLHAQHFELTHKVVQLKSELEERQAQKLKIEGYLEKLNEEGRVLTEKEQKRQKTYEERIAKQEKEISAAEIALRYAEDALNGFEREKLKAQSEEAAAKASAEAASAEAMAAKAEAQAIKAEAEEAAFRIRQEAEARANEIIANASAKTEQITQAFEAFDKELADGTIYRAENGRLTAKDGKKLTAGGPLFIRVIGAVVDRLTEAASFVTRAKSLLAELSSLKSKVDAELAAKIDDMKIHVTDLDKEMFAQIRAGRPVQPKPPEDDEPSSGPSGPGW